MRLGHILIGLMTLLSLSCVRHDLRPGESFDQTAMFYSINGTSKQLASFSQPITVSVTNDDVGEVKKVEYRVSLAKKNIDQNIELEVSVDSVFVDKFNQVYGTQYLVFPDSLGVFSDTLSIQEGSINSNIGTALLKISDSLESGLTYLFPLTITPINSNIDVLSGSQTLLYSITKPKSAEVVTSIALNRDEYLKVDNATSTVADIGGTFTIEGLVYVERFRGASDPGDVGISTFMGTEGETLLRFGDAGIAPSMLQANGEAISLFDAKKWYHIALVVDGGNSKVYIDGNLESSFSASGSLDAFYIGRSYNDNRGLWGRVAEIKLWDVARTEDEIQMGMTGVDPEMAGLYAYWKMDAIKDNKIPDASGNNHLLSLWGQGTDNTQKTIVLYSEPTPVIIK